jgi:hypothetical protein
MSVISDDNVNSSNVSVDFMGTPLVYGKSLWELLRCINKVRGNSFDMPKLVSQKWLSVIIETCKLKQFLKKDGQIEMRINKTRKFKRS